MILIILSVLNCINNTFHINKEYLGTMTIKVELSIMVIQVNKLEVPTDSIDFGTMQLK